MTLNGVDPRTTVMCHECRRTRQVVQVAQQYTYLGATLAHPQENLPEGVRRITGALSCGHPFAVIVPLAFVAIIREYMPEKEK
jgi:hypothetical protein